MNNLQNQQKSFGHWDSKISTDMLAAKSNRLGQMQFIGNKLYWLESRADDKGRGVIVEYSDNNTQDITPKEYSVRTRVHEYGSGDFWGKDSLIIFANDKDQRLYCHNFKSQKIEPITPISDVKYGLRYADGDIDSQRKFTVCVREQHPENSTGHQVINDLVMVNLASNQITVVAQGYDFYSNPRIHCDGKKICWLQWNHPNMPWDATELWQADIDSEGQVTNSIKVAGGPQVSIYNPQWTNANEIVYVSDQNGWWHLYKNKELLHEFQEIEFGFPQWQFGCNSFQLVGDRIFVIGTKAGRQNLYLIDVNNGDIKQLESEFSYFNGQLVAGNDSIYFMASSCIKALNIYRLNTNNFEFNPLQDKPSVLSIEDIAVGEHIEFSTTNGDSAYGFFYPPRNSSIKTVDEELPPLIVMSHGGPTGMTDAGFDLQIQFWTSRGFAVADVNYRGSTGYGREYREALKGQWGIYDVDDCIAMAEYLAKQGHVDGERLAIRGGSAGGYTTLCALTFHDKFKVGMSRYGVADLMSLAQDSHKFEIRYLDSVVGPLPEAKQVYLDRSPSEHTDKLSCPILLLQGSEDKVVPPSQSEAMVKALEAQGLPYQYIEFAGEWHGFRKPETIIKAFEAELEFYRKYLL